MTVIGEAFIAVRPTGAGEFGAETSGVLGSLGKIAAVAGFATGAIAFLGDSFHEFIESQAIMAQTEQVIRSTGQAAHVTADEVSGFATTLSDLSGQDDEAIQRGENLLLTFTNIRNEVGKGNDIFTRTTGTLVDMAQAMSARGGGEADAAGAAIQLGKALNNPTAGITALTRVGVAFTDQQKEQIKTLQKSGNILSAQKVILRELNKEFGGSAEAFGETDAGKVARLGVAFDNLKEQVGGAVAVVVPFLEDATAALGYLDGSAGTTEEDLAKMADTAKGATADAVNSLAQKLLQGKVSADQFTLQVADLGKELTANRNAFTSNAEAQAAGQAVIDRGAYLVGAYTKNENALRAELQRVADATRDQTVASEGAAAARLAEIQTATDLYNAELLLSGGILGVEASVNKAKDASRDYRDAVAEVNRLEEHGKEGTQKYADAVRDKRDAELDAVVSQVAVRKEVQDYIKSLDDGVASQDQAIAQIKQFGREAGLSQQDIQGLIQKVKRHIDQLDDIPGTKHTEITVDTGAANAVLKIFSNNIDTLETKLRNLDSTFIGVSGSTVSSATRGTPKRHKNGDGSKGGG